LLAALGFKKVDSQKSEIEGAQPEDHRRTEKRLARGLEDVSHLFLSQPTGRPAEKGEEQNTPCEQALPEPAQPRTPIVLHASPALNRELLVSLLNKYTAVLEEGMHAIDSNVPCDPYGPIDLLAVDGADQLAVVDVDTAPNNELFLRGIAHYDWFVRNNPIIRRMYHGRVINFSAQPRLFLVAPDFSPLLKCAAQRSACPQVYCFGYRTVAMPGGMGVLFERA
jgi:hypothetical protein